MNPCCRLVVAALLSAAVCASPARAQSGAEPVCDSVRVDCCALRPSYTDAAYSGFTGTVAAATYWSPNLTGPDSQVLTVIDFQNQGAAPIGTAGPWTTPKYWGPGGNWNKATLGTIFGLTFDDAGNIYVTASSSYNGDYFPGNNSGRVYRINNGSGTVTNFNNLPNAVDGSLPPGENRPGLGNITFDCDHRQLFVSDFEDGKIYRLSMTPLAAPLSSYDHGAPDNGAPGFAPLGERVWAVQYHAGRVYYSLWVEDMNRPSSQANQIWSVALDGTGNFLSGSQRLELNVPAFTAGYSHPVSDLSFGPQGQMLLAERSMYDDTSPYAHQSRLLEYICAPVPGGKAWLPSGANFSVGEIDNPPGMYPSSAGGCDYDLGVGGRTWVSGDALEFNTDFVYGLQGLPAAGGDYSNSILIDDNNMLDGDKTQIGDVEISCHITPPIQSEMCGIKYNDVNGNGVHDAGEPTMAGWTIVLTGPSGTQSTVTGQGGTYCFQNLAPGTYTVHEVPQANWTQTQPLTVSYTVTVPPGTGNLDFGNQRNCPTPTHVTCTAGRVDSFATNDGPEQPSPDPALLSVLQSCSAGQPPLGQFDVIPCNRCFGHTFDKCWSDSCTVVGARLTLRLRAGDCSPQNDSLCFMQGGTEVWCIGLSALRNFVTGGADPLWTVNDDMTVTLDLAALLPDGNGVTNILAALQDGNLGVMIFNSTGVDYMRLDLDLCCPLGTIQGQKYFDVNHNGVLDAGEPPLAGWTITLTGPVSGTTTTNAGGNWQFANLPPGNYTVHEANQPGWVNTAPPGGFFNVAVPAGGTVSGLVFLNWRCGGQGPCTNAPATMRSWWPLDEAAGPSADDVALNNAGTWVGAPVAVAGRVGNALHFSSAGDYVRVPDDPSLDFGTGPLSIDAWVRMTTMQPNTIRTLVDKRAGSSANPTGYSFFVFNGRLGFQLDDGSPSLNYIAPANPIDDGQWHHVAVMVNRTSATGGRLMVDGSVVHTFNPTTRPGSISNASDLRLGTQVYPGFSGLEGELDEVEIFARALDSLEVRAIWLAGSSGKCKDRVSVPALTTYCVNQTTANATLTLCNTHPTSQTYNWSVAGLPVGPGCTIAGPTVFTPASGTVVVPPGGCVNVVIAIARPAGLVPGQLACWQATVLNTTSNLCFTARGKLSATNKWCIRSPNPDIVAPANSAVRAEWSVVKIVQNFKDLPWRVYLANEDGNPDATGGMRLNGLPPGEPVIGTLTVQPGDSYPHLIDVDVDFDQPDTYRKYHLVLEADTDGDGTYEPIESVGIRASLPEDLPVAVEEPAARATLSGVRVQPNPFTGATRLQLTLARAARVEVRVYDVSGREVRRLGPGALEAGVHSIPFDGYDDHGSRLGDGVYLVRVQAGAEVRTAKLVRIR